MKIVYLPGILIDSLRSVAKNVFVVCQVSLIMVTIKFDLCKLCSVDLL